MVHVIVLGYLVFVIVSGYLVFVIVSGYLVFIIVIVEGPGHFFNVNKFLGSILLQIALKKRISDKSYVDITYIFFSSVISLFLEVV
jgi:hypothetical protein